MWQEDMGMTVRWLSPAQVTALVATPPLTSPAYLDLARRLRLHIVDGRVSPGVRMPSERALAVALGVSRSTITSAYAHLTEEGYLRAQVGSGSFVRLPRVRRPSSAPGADPDSDPISLTTASGPAPAGLASAFDRAAGRLPEILGLSGYLPDGLPELRERIAERFTVRGLPTDPQQVIVTSGALAALNIVLRTLVGPGDRVLLESPTYPAAIDAVRRSGARPVAYPLGPDGWQADDVNLSLRQSAPRLAYLTPDFHNPTGLTMSEGARADVAAALKRNRTTAVIDETLVELRLDGEETADPPPLAAWLPEAITVGSASKAFWGGLRIGWIRAPLELVPALVETRAADDLGSAVFEQLVTAELLADPDAVLTGYRDRVRRQRDHLVAEVSRVLPEWTFSRPSGGLSLWLQLPTEISTQLAAVSEQHGLVLTAGPRFFVGGGGERHLRVPYTADPPVLSRAVQRLLRLWHAVRTGQRVTGPAPRMRLTA